MDKNNLWQNSFFETFLLFCTDNKLKKLILRGDPTHLLLCRLYYIGLCLWEILRQKGIPLSMGESHDNLIKKYALPRFCFFKRLFLFLITFEICNRNRINI